MWTWEISTTSARRSAGVDGVVAAQVGEARGQRRVGDEPEAVECRSARVAWPSQRIAGEEASGVERRGPCGRGQSGGSTSGVEWRGPCGREQSGGDMKGESGTALPDAANGPP